MAEEEIVRKGRRPQTTAGRLTVAQTASGVMLEEGKLPPQAVEVEQAVLGALMLDANVLTEVIDTLKAKYFYKPEHQKIYQVITELFSSSQPVDILTVAQALKAKGELEVVGGAYYISSLTNRVSSGAHAEAHVKIIQQKYIQRELIRIGGGIVKDAYEDTTDVLELLDTAEGQLLNISEDNFRSDYIDMQTLVKQAIQEVEEVAKLEDKMSGVPSGFVELDRMTNGWQKGNLLIVAARPGMGKTAFALTMARNIAVEFKQPVAFFSLEMSAIEVVSRLISSEALVKGEKLKKGNLTETEWSQLHTKVDSLAGAPLFIDETPALTMFELRAKCRRLKMQHNIGMVMIDYLQLM
ncbi:MAG: replicative DNA helicase, partial [Bacteroidales bacterium]|nr:replicative DNA helicase [Bacteroidales bacterium]